MYARQKSQIDSNTKSLMGDHQNSSGMKTGLADKLFDREIDNMDEEDSFEEDYEMVDIRGRRKALQNLEDRNIEFTKPLYSNVINMGDVTGVTKLQQLFE